MGHVAAIGATPDEAVARAVAARNALARAAGVSEWR
jgi:hypothetical protein